MDLLVAMTDHHIWLVGQLFDRADRLSPEVLDAPIPNYVGSVTDRPTLRSLLSRLVGQLDMWNQAVANRPYDFGIEAGESLQSMRARLARCGPVFLGQVRDATEHHTLGETFVDATGAEPMLFTYGAMIAHVLTYAAYRRTLAVELLQAAGITDLADDPLSWPPITAVN
jgi:hypothetical protein